MSAADPWEHSARALKSDEKLITLTINVNAASKVRSTFSRRGLDATLLGGGEQNWITAGSKIVRSRFGSRSAREFFTAKFEPTIAITTKTKLNCTGSSNEAGRSVTSVGGGVDSNFLPHEARTQQAVLLFLWVFVLTFIGVRSPPRGLTQVGVCIAYSDHRCVSLAQHV